MSSHHIVRDDQEPALIIANGLECNNELLGQLLEWSPLVIVLDSAIERVIQLGIKVDVLLGDFDRNFDAHYYKENHYPIEIIHTPDQDKTDLEKAFEYLIEKGHKAANVVWATGKRADHTLNNFSDLALYRNKLKIVLFDDHSKVFLLPESFKKWYPKDSIISLIPLGKVDGISTENLFYPLQNESLELGFRTGSSNYVAEDGIVTITHENGNLLLIEGFD
ncbi:thiamine diphosphokinase [Flavobacterium terrigena]|uniref:Thiamine diphosphokinase n=1 Tax=Flavobacterium terrigena TaxID=402734 RepID=A0A1H6R570_9FLAO|nr:thiamine diphosphokinase [Flavobacterium terrigena]SEI46930.1 thiamine pyrophosphokinase [Flavobacterium terrigena]